MNKHAQAMGRIGGRVKSDAKTRAVKENGRKGGRPIIPFACPKCGGEHFGRDTEAIDIGPYPGSQGAGAMSTSEYHHAPTVRVLRTVRCHTQGCGWRGEWPPRKKAAREI